jgi:glycosyltransferase involved in cell wall biosynthesis
VRTVILVPRRADNGHRDQLWAALKPRWQRLHPEWDIVEGHHDEGPFNRSAAINRAAAQAGEWDTAVVIDSDVALPPDNVYAAVETAQETGRVTWGHRQWVGLTENATKRLLLRPSDLADPVFAPRERDIDRTNPISWSCCIAVTREAWDRIGGFDERFRGWGWEDMAFQSVACGLVGHERIEGEVYHLWHPRAPGLGKNSFDVDSITNARLGLRYMMALRRDHGLHDGTDADRDMERDMANVRKTDTKWGWRAKRFGLPDWSGWWPTLEDLVAGKVASRSVALIVHSGGFPETWETRSGYLRQSLESIAKHIDHPWERRVIFSDWGRSAELDAIAEEYGYTVVGPSGRVGYTESMRSMWRYIRHEVPTAHIFQTEDDFIFDRDVDIEAMAKVLDEHGDIVQMALLRGPIDEREAQEGTVLGWPPDAFAAVQNGAGQWLEHRKFFTCNPMLMPRSTALSPWPRGYHSETKFGKSLFRFNPRVRSAFWGSGEQWVTHLGVVRASPQGLTY